MLETLIKKQKKKITGLKKLNFNFLRRDNIFVNHF